MIRLLDRNCDEAITFEEFCRFACMLPRNQIENNNVAFCWVDSADFMDGLAFRLNMVRRPRMCLNTATARAPPALQLVPPPQCHPCHETNCTLLKTVQVPSHSRQVAGDRKGRM